MTPKIPARVIHTSIRVPCTREEYEAICRAAAARGAHSKAVAVCRHKPDKANPRTVVRVERIPE